MDPLHTLLIGLVGGLIIGMIALSRHQQNTYISTCDPSSQRVGLGCLPLVWIVILAILLLGLLGLLPVRP